MEGLHNRTLLYISCCLLWTYSVCLLLSTFIPVSIRQRRMVPALAWNDCSRLLPSCSEFELNHPCYRKLDFGYSVGTGHLSSWITICLFLYCLPHCKRLNPETCLKWLRTYNTYCHKHSCNWKIKRGYVVRNPFAVKTLSR